MSFVKQIRVADISDTAFRNEIRILDRISLIIRAKKLKYNDVFCRLLRLFCIYLTSAQTAEVTKINRDSVRRVLRPLQAKILNLAKEKSFLKQEKTKPANHISESRKVDAGEDKKSEKNFRTEKAQ